MNKDVLKIFIGYDAKETVAWHVMCQSIIENTTKPVSIIPLSLQGLKSFYNRQYDSKQSNEFSFTRFLVPFLCGYKGDAVYFDCDMLLTTDIADLFKIGRYNALPVSVVKHEYVPKNTTKYLGNKQYQYPRKNWSSVVYWDCEAEQNRILTPEFINDAESKVLHRFLWLDNSEIGDLPKEWNFLVGEYFKTPEVPKNIHWTVGGPYFNEYKDADYASLWNEGFKRTVYCDQISDKK